MSELEVLKKFANSVMAAGQAMLDDIKQMQKTESNAGEAIAAATTMASAVTVFTPPPRMIMKEKAASSSVAAAKATATATHDSESVLVRDDNDDCDDNEDQAQPESEDQGAIFYSLTSDAQRFDTTPKTTKEGSKPRRILPEACNDAICVWRMCDVPDVKIKDVFKLHGNKIKTKNKTKNEGVCQNNKQCDKTTILQTAFDVCSGLKKKRSSNI
jgi:hypothetical protein